MDDLQIKELNLLYLGEYRATDVIAFDIVNTKKHLVADIAVSAETAVRNAKTFHSTPRYELFLYVIHGVLHLLGYNDDTIRKRELMQKKAENLLTKLKIKP